VAALVGIKTVHKRSKIQAVALALELTSNSEQLLNQATMRARRDPATAADELVNISAMSVYLTLAPFDRKLTIDE
jgi:capsule polysaccharide export protein KpsE/RkpR